MQSQLSDMLTEALTAHGMASRRDGAAVILNDVVLTFYPDVKVSSARPDHVVLQVAFAARAPILGEKVLWNVFAGVGENEEAAAQNAFVKFLMGPFHVLLSALGNHLCAQGAEAWRDVAGERANWRICESPLITQGFDDPGGVPFAAVQDELVQAFARQGESAVHWVNVFFAFMDGKRAALDVQLDGEPWLEGARILERWSLQPGDSYKSGRYFFIALREVA